MPAEDTLTYKVELDAADLPQQLEQLRAQMDMAVGAMAFSNAPAPPEMTQSPMNFMFNTAPTNPAQQMIDTTSQGFLATNQMMAAQEQGGLLNFLNSNVEAFRLGYAKFHGGMERMGLMVPPAPLVQFPPQGVTAYTEQMEALQGLGYPGGPLFTATGMSNSAAAMPGVISGALFAFVTSFDEVVVVLFLAGLENTTIPIQMWVGLREQLSPTIMAVATCLIVMSTLILVTAELLRRRSERLRGINR